MVSTISKRAIAGILLGCFWIGITLIPERSMSTEAWASLVPLRCPLAFFFHINCPTCGLGRALIAAALGHGAESFHYHPLALPLFWGSQALLVCWIVWPQAWTAVRHFAQGLMRQRTLVWLFVLLYSVWGFCWRAPL